MKNTKIQIGSLEYRSTVTCQMLSLKKLGAKWCGNMYNYHTALNAKPTL